MTNFHSIIATNAEMRVALVWYPNRPFVFIHEISVDGAIGVDALHSVYIQLGTTKEALAWMDGYIDNLTALKGVVEGSPVET